MRKRLWHALLAIVAIASLLAVFASAVHAADMPTYDNSSSRLRFIQSHSSSQLYMDLPLYLELPAGQQSFSTPTVVGDTLYQYTWDSSGQGHLYALQLPGTDYSQVFQQAGSTPYVINSASYAQPPITFNAGFTPGRLNAAAGQDSLSTGPYQGGAPDGAQYQAIAVGKYLYTWPAGSYPQGGTPPTGQVIIANPSNTNYQVDENPLITPPVTISGLGASGSPTTWQSPVAVVGSWDGGLIAWPTYVPSGYTTNQVRYLTSYDYTHSVAALTSDPTWIGSCSVGSACVAFGVAGAHPRVVLLDVTTGNYKVIGTGLIGAQVADTVVYDNTGPQAGNPLLIVQDEYGKIYSFNLSGSLLATYPSGSQNPSWINRNSLILGKDMSVLTDLAGQTLFAIGGGGAMLGAFDPATLSPMDAPTAGFSPGVDSPTSMVNANGNATVVLSNSNGDLYLFGAGSLFTGALGNTYNQTIATPSGTAYVGYGPDEGPKHWLVGWTNGDPHSRPAIVAFVPQPYIVGASVNPSDVQSGSSLIITGRPYPAGVTFDNGYNGNGPNGNAPLEAQIENAQGQPVTGMIPMTHEAPDQWTVNWTPPANTTGSPVEYQVVVYAWSEIGQTAQSSPVSFTVEAAAPPTQQPQGSSGALSMTCGYGHGGLPIVVSHTCTIPSALQGNSTSWFAYNYNYGAKFGDTLDFNLAIPQPKLPNLRVVALTGVQLTASIQHQVGYPNLPGYQGYNPGNAALYNYYPQTTAMTQIGQLTAQANFVESWSGYPPPQPLGTTVWTGNMTADWKAIVSYSYQQRVPPYQICVPANPKPGQQPVCTTVYNYRTETGQFTETGNASAPLAINGSDYYTISTPAGY